MGRDRAIVSKAMRRVRSLGTSPELIFRKALWSRGVRYRLHDKRLPGTPDLVLPAARLAVFVDGDYWHGNQWLRRGHASIEDQFEHVQGREYWTAKIRRTMERDRNNTAALVRQGWRVLRVWESQLIADLPNYVELAAQAPRAASESSALGALAQRTFAEFFAGIGLVRLALERQGWTAAFANDIDQKKYEMYTAHFTEDPADQYRVQDIHTLTADDLPTVSLATASFPCTDLSLAGARLGLAGPQSGSIYGFLKLIGDMGPRKPPLVLLENVPGFLTSHGGQDFRAVLKELNSLGYVVDAFQVDASHFVPQSRVRLFVVGVRATVSDTSIGPLTIGGPDMLRPPGLLAAIRANADVLWRTQPLPTPPSRSISLRDILEDLPDDAPEWWGESRATYLLSQMSARHRQLADQLIVSDTVQYGTVFRRVRNGRSMAELRADGIAGCLRTPRGGSGRQILFRGGRGRYAARLLTPRECARLMGAPELNITTPLNQALFGLGDAVCAPVVEWIARHYLNVVVTQAIHGAIVGPATSAEAPA